MNRITHGFILPIAATYRIRMNRLRWMRRHRNVQTMTVNSMVSPFGKMMILCRTRRGRCLCRITTGMCWFSRNNGRWPLAIIGARRIPTRSAVCPRRRSSGPFTASGQRNCTKWDRISAITRPTLIQANWIPLRIDWRPFGRISKAWTPRSGFGNTSGRSTEHAPCWWRNWTTNSSTSSRGSLGVRSTSCRTF